MRKPIDIPKAALDLRAKRGIPQNRTKPKNGTWFEIRNQDGSDTTELLIYDEIGFWGVTAQMLVEQLAQITTPNILLRMNTPGGEVFDGVAIYGALLMHPANVVVRIEGVAASAGSFIAMAGDEVEIMRHGSMMIHDAMGVCIGNCTEMQMMADILDGVSDNIADVYASRAGGTLEQWRELMRAETWYYNGEAAVEAGLADRVVDPRQEEDEHEEEMPAAAWDVSIFQNRKKNAPGNQPAPEPEFDAAAFRQALKEAIA